MENEPKRNIEKLVYDCFKEISNHTLQSDVISPNIKIINNNLIMILKNLEGIQENSKKYRSHSGERKIVRSADRVALYKVAYAMSRFDYHIVNDMIGSHFNQTEAFEYLANKLNIKTTTLRNYRDRFDPYVKQEKSKRRGWHQIELTPELQEVKEFYDGEDYDSIKNDFLTFLNDDEDQ